MRSLSKYIPLIIVVCILALPLYGLLAIIGIFPFPEWQTRSREIYAQSTMRTLATGLEVYRMNNGTYFPGNNYFGPLSPAMLNLIHAEEFDYFDPQYAWAIDPFNKDKRKPIYRGPRYCGDRGSWVRIKGSDFTYFTDGSKYWALVSYGPDQDLDATVNALTEALKKMQLPNDDEDVIFEYRWDPTNGTFSNGDIFRFSDY